MRRVFIFMAAFAFMAFAIPMVAPDTGPPDVGSVHFDTLQNKAISTTASVALHAGSVALLRAPCSACWSPMNTPSTIKMEPIPLHRWEHFSHVATRLRHDVPSLTSHPARTKALFIFGQAPVIPVTSTPLLL